MPRNPGLVDATPLALIYPTPCIPGKAGGARSLRGSFCFLAGEPGTAFVREAIFLEAAGGFAGNGTFQPAGGRQRFEVSFAEMLAVLHSHHCLKALAGSGLAGSLQRFGDLRGDLRGGDSQGISQ